MPVTVAGLPIAPGAYNSATYSGANTLTVNYTDKAKVSLGASVRSLRVRIEWPVEASPSRARALFMYTHMGGWTDSDLDDVSIDILRWPVRCGAIVAVIEVRVDGDDPIDDGVSESLLAQQRAVYAAAFDLDRALQFVLSQYRINDDFSIEPNWVFLSGSSAGGITGLIYPQLFSGRPVAGMIPACAAFGALGTGLTDADDYIRNTLGITEAGLAHPTCSWGDPVNDDRITPTRMIAFQDAAELIAGSVVNVTSTGHVGLLGVADPTVIASFMTARCAAIPRARSGIVVS